jgi:ABC-type multidrug transport system fused ATPase/permease subunit
MIIFLLLVIIAILLFGSSAVLGVIGFVLGFIVLVFALTLGASALATVPAWGWWTMAVVVGGPLIYFVIVESRKEQRLRRTLADLTAQAEEAQQHYDNVKQYGVRSTTKFYNDGLNAKKRKRLAQQAASDTCPEK